jgi:hypothetical protein
VDDLPELLAEPAFPAGARKVLFDPADVHAEEPGYVRVSSWEACGEALLAPWEALA